MKNTINALRKERGISQTKLALKIGISRQYLLEIEKGNSAPTINVAKKVSNYFNCSIDDVFFNKNVAHGLQNNSITTS